MQQTLRWGNAVLFFVDFIEVGIIVIPAQLGGVGQGKSAFHILPHHGHAFFGKVTVYGNVQLTAKTVGQGGRGNVKMGGDAANGNGLGKMLIDIL